MAHPRFILAACSTSADAIVDVLCYFEADFDANVELRRRSFWALEKVYSEALKSTSEDRSGG